TTFVSPSCFRGHISKLRKMSRNRSLTIIVQTESLAREWANVLGPAAVRMIPLPSERIATSGGRGESRRILGLPEDLPIIAVIGCIAPAKGYIELFEAIRDLPRDFRVLLIGDTGAWVSPDPRIVVQNAGWTENTLFHLRFVPESQMSVLFNAVDIVTLLYRQPNGSSGILSLCQRYGVPVLATRFGEIGKQVISHHLGLTADPHNPAEVRDALTTLLSRTRDEVGIRCGAILPASDEQLQPMSSWASVARAHVALYDDLYTGKTSE